ncbi:MAG: hypothetical protein V2A73_18265, partial [Pseudomonadota bacterium]
HDQRFCFTPTAFSELDTELEWRYLKVLCARATTRQQATGMNPETALCTRRDCPSPLVFPVSYWYRRGLVAARAVLGEESNGRE